VKEEPGVGPIENRERVFIDLTVENNDDDNDDEEQRSAERPVEFERDESCGVIRFTDRRYDEY